MKYLVIPAVLGLALTAMPVHAANVNANNLVNVDVSNVLNDLDLDFDVTNTTVAIPIGLAANVCGTTVNALQQQFEQNGEANCTANNASPALVQQIRRAQG